MEDETMEDEDETMEDEDETMEVDEEDRISNLPEEILLNILTFLPTTKDSVRTSLVSKRWISLWKLVPSLAFCHDGNSKAKFTTRVHKTLLYYDRNTDIQSFSLDFDFTVVEEPRYDYERGDYYHDPDDDDDLCDSDIDSWVYTAIKLNVKQLELSFYEDEDNRDHDLAYYNLPRSLFRYKLLTRLKLSYCGFRNFSDEIQWISLRSLSIHQAGINDELLQKILRVCAKLECLGLSKCYGIRKIDVVSRNLKELRLGKCGILTKDSDLKAGERVKISTPNLELLVISRPLYYREFVVEKLHSLVEAWIYPMECGDGDFRNSKNIVSLTEILRTVQHAKKLTFGPWCLRGRHVDSLPRSFSNCKSVTLDVNIVYDWCRSRLPNIFEICPEMETFILRLTQEYFFGYTDDKFSREYHHLPRHLKIVKIYGVTPCLIEEVKHVIDFVRFILKHGTTLEKVSINTHWGHRIPDKETLYKLYEELINCPRSSPAVVVQLSNDIFSDIDVEIS